MDKIDSGGTSKNIDPYRAWDISLGVFHGRICSWIGYGIWESDVCILK
jgi:hypothetical protein